jgi:hypothetical protein
MGFTDDSDSAVEEDLRRAPDARWRALSDAARSYLAAPEASLVRWQTPTPERSVVGGVEREVLGFSVPVYSETVSSILALFYELGVVRPFDASRWDGLDRYRGGAGLASAGRRGRSSGDGLSDLRDSATAHSRRLSTTARSARSWRE